MYVLASLLTGRGPPQTRPPPACAVLISGGGLETGGWHLGADISLVELRTGRLQVTTIAVTRGCSLTAVLTDNTTQASGKILSRYKKDNILIRYVPDFFILNIKI